MGFRMKSQFMPMQTRFWIYRQNPIEDMGKENSEFYLMKCDRGERI
jgi:hypothetical protein